MSGDVPAGSLGDKGAVVVDQSDMDLLNSEDDKLDEKSSLPTPDEETEETTDEVKEDELEAPEDEIADPEKTAEVADSGSIDFKAINAKYPELLKEFPQLRDSYFAAREYRKLFTDVETAKESVQKSQAFEKFDEIVSEGNPDQLLPLLHQASPKGLEKFSMGFVRSLYKGNPELCQKVVDPIIKNTLSSLQAEARTIGNTNLDNAIKFVSKQLFGTFDVPKVIEQKEPEPSPDELKLQEEREQFHLEKYTDFRKSIVTSLNSTLQKAVERDLPKDMPEFVKKATVKAVVDEVHKQMAADKVHIANINRLWENAARNRYSKDQEPRIISAFLGRAKNLLPAIKSKYLAGVIKSDNTNQPPATKRMGKTGTVPGGQKPIPNVRNINMRKTSDSDIMDGNFTLNK